VAKAQALQALCGRYGVPLKAAAIQYPLRHPAVTCVLTGARAVAELEENLAMLAHPVPDELWHALEAADVIREPL
jgi:D-threo-aldose 1-dehydrogenase